MKIPIKILCGKCVEDGLKDAIRIQNQKGRQPPKTNFDF